MKKISILLFFFALVGTVKTQAQSNPAKIYANDSTGFTAYPAVGLLENLKLPVKYTQLEINTWISPYVKGKRNYHEYRNLYRYPAPAQKLADSVVLTQCDLLKCFTACLCPTIFPWYISAQAADNKQVTIGDTSNMKTFLGSINNPFNAYLWLQPHDMYADIPLKTSARAKYKKVKNGYLICYKARINGYRHVAFADVTYFIGNDFRVILVSTRHIVETNYQI
jgi:hypothetical protein